MRTALVTASVLGLILIGRHFGQVGPGLGAVPEPRRFSRVLDGRGPRRRRRRAAQSHPAQRRHSTRSLARDSMLTLCDSTDRGFASFDDGSVVSRTVMQSNTLIIQCFNNGATVQLHLRFELVERGLMIETATLPDGSPVSTIVLHRVSTN